MLIFNYRVLSQISEQYCFMHLNEYKSFQCWFEMLLKMILSKVDCAFPLTTVFFFSFAYTTSPAAVVFFRSSKHPYNFWPNYFECACVYLVYTFASMNLFVSNLWNSWSHFLSVVKAYTHIEDIAKGHIAALQHWNSEDSFRVSY